MGVAGIQRISRKRSISIVAKEKDLTVADTKTFWGFVPRSLGAQEVFIQDRASCGIPVVPGKGKTSILRF